MLEEEKDAGILDTIQDAGQKVIKSVTGISPLTNKESLDYKETLKTKQSDLDYGTRRFGELYNTIEELKASGADSRTLRKVVNDSGLNVSEYNSLRAPHKKYLETLYGVTEEQPEGDYRKNILGPIQAFPAAIGGATREIMETSGQIGELLLPEFAEDALKNIEKGAREHETSKKISRAFDNEVTRNIGAITEQVFDPYIPEDLLPAQIPKVLSQFYLGWKVLEPIKVLNGGKNIVFKSAIKGGIADVISFDEDEARISNYLLANPEKANEAQKIWNEILESTVVGKEADSFVVKKAKQFVEGTGLGIAFDTAFRTFGSVFKKINYKNPDNIIQSETILPDKTKERIASTGTKIKKVEDLEKEPVIKKVIDESEEGEEILSYGSGRPDKDNILPEVESLKKGGAKVTPHDLSLNMKNIDGSIKEPYKNSKDALQKKYDKVVANNVIDEAPNEYSLGVVLAELSRTTKPTGKTVINITKKDINEFENNAKLFFEDVKLVDTKKKEKIFELSKPVKEVVSSKIFQTPKGPTLFEKIKENIGYIPSKVKYNLNRWFNSRGNIGDRITSKIVESEGAKNIVKQNIEKMANDFQKVLKDNFQVSNANKLDDVNRKKINSIISFGDELPDETLKQRKVRVKKERQEAYRSLAEDGREEVAKAALRFRKMLDAAQREIKNSGALGTNLEALVDDTTGLYLTKNYEVHINPKYRQSIPNKSPTLDEIKKGNVSGEGLKRYYAREAIKKVYKDERASIIQKLEDDIGKKIKEPEPGNPFPIGGRVVAGDRGNIGTVVGVEGDNVTVRFVSPEGLIGTKTFNSTQLKPLTKRRRDSLRRSYEVEELTDDEAEAIINRILNTEHIDLGRLIDDGFSKGKSESATKIFKKKDVTLLPQIQDLLNVVDDPLQNFLSTYSKLKTLTNEYKLYKDIARILEEEGRVTTGPIGDNYKKLAELFTYHNNPNIKNPLDNLFGTPEFSKSLGESTNLMQGKIFNTGSIFTPLVKLKGFSQKMKTVWNHVTHFKNFQGNLFFLAANNNFKNLFDSFKYAKDYVTNKKNFKVVNEYLLGKGVLNTSMDFNIIKNIFEINKTPEELERFFISKVSGQGLKTKKSNNIIDLIKMPFKKSLDVAKKADDKLSKIYMAEDNFFKVGAFFGELRKYNKLYRNQLTPEQKLKVTNPFKIDGESVPDFVVDRAIQVVRDTMPNYNMTPMAVKTLSRAPFVGNFVTFSAEVFRNGTNSIITSLQDMVAGLRTRNPALHINGVKRLAATTAVAIGAGQGASYGTRKLHDISTEAYEGVRSLLFEDQNSQDVAFTSGIERDKNGDLVVDAVNLSYTNPYAILREPLLKAIITYEKTKDIKSLEEAVALAGYEAFLQTLKPFAGETIVGESILDVILAMGRPETTRNPVFRETDSFTEAVGKSTVHLAKDYIPGSFEGFVNLLLVSKIEQEKGEGEGVTPSGFPKPLDFESFKFATGISEQKLNLNKLFAFQSKNYVRRIEEPIRNFYKEVNNLQITDPQEVANLYRNALEKQYKESQKFYVFSKLASQTGLTNTDKIKALKKERLLTKVKSDKGLLLAPLVQTVNAFQPSPNDFKRTQETRRINQQKKSVYNEALMSGLLEQVWREYNNKPLVYERDEDEQ
jgi:hypothetical protein